MYPSNYNPQTRTCQFIEEFNGAASFRMWPLKNKIHIEVYTPDMKRRKEKEVSCHVASANEYVRKMYAKFKNYKPKETTTSLYIDTMYGYVKVPDGEYSEPIVLDRLNYFPAKLFEDFVLKTFPKKTLDELQSINESIMESPYYYARRSDQMKWGLIDLINKDEPVMTSTNVFQQLEELNQRMNRKISRKKHLSLDFENAINEDSNKLFPSGSCALDDFADEVSKASALRSNFENAIVYHYCKLNSLEMSESNVVKAIDGEFTQLFIDGNLLCATGLDTRFSVSPFMHRGNVSNLMFPSKSVTYTRYSKPYNFVLHCIYEQSEFDNIISEYDKFVNTPSYEELLEAISKKPPSHLPTPDFTNMENVEPSENDFFSGNWLFDY